MKHIVRWNKSYSTSDEYKLRMDRFLEVDAFIQEVNAPGSEYTHKAGHNKFSTWTEEEFMTMMNQPEAPQRLESVAEHVATDPTGSADWITKNCVNPIQN